MQQPPNPGQAGPPPQQFQPRGHHLHHGIHHHHTPPPTVSAATGVVVSQGGQPQNPQGKIIYYNQDGTAPASIPTVFMPQPNYLYSHQIPRMPAQMPNQFFLYQTPGMAPFSAPIQQGYTQPPPNIPNQAQQLRPQTPPNPSASMGQHVIAANTAYIQTNPVAAAAPGGQISMQPAAHPQPPPHLSQAGIPTSIQAQPMQPPTQQRVLERRVRQPLKIINPNTNEEVDPTASAEAPTASAAVVVTADEQPQEKTIENAAAADVAEKAENEAKNDIVEAVVPVASVEKETPHEEKPISSSSNTSNPAVAPVAEGKKVEAAPIIHPASSSNDSTVKAVESINEDQQDGKSKQKSKKDAKARRPSEAKELPAAPAAVVAASAKEPVDAAEPPPVEKDEAKINNNVIKEPEVVPVIEAPKAPAEAPRTNHVEGNHVTDEGAISSSSIEDVTEAKEGSVENGTASTTSSNPASKSSSQIKLKYTYPEEQWSPINTEGKKQYDRNFLIELSKDPLSMRKPENLPSMDIIKDRPVHDKVYNAPQANQNKDWMPGFVKSTTSKSGINTKGGSRDRSAKRPDRGGGGNMGGGGPPTVINIDRNFELHKTENAWKPVKLLVEADVVELDPLQELERNVRAILNKLTPQKFDKLVKQFIDLTIDTEPKLEACIELIFEKAVDEPEFSVAYARLCEVLQKKKVDNDAAEASREQEEGTTAVKSDFRKLILSRCQREFERDYMEGFDKEKFEAQLAAAESEDKRKELQLEFEEKERRARRRSLGNIRFIGELYKLKMLHDRTMHAIITSLIKKIDEESLECLCWLLQTIGKALEQSTLDRMRPGGEDRKTGVVTNPFDGYFTELENIIKSNKSLPSRVRFLLQDAVDLRRSNWKPRREKAGPKTLDQIHKEAEREKTQQQLLDMKPMGTVGGGGGGNRGQDRDGARKRSSRGPNQQSNDDEWNTVPFSGRGSKNQSTAEKIDAQKIQSLASNRKDAENMSLGPGTRFWGKGSGSAAKPQNRYAAISGSDEGARRSNFNSSASMGNFARGGRDRDGGSRGASMDERQAAIDSVRQFSTGMSTNGPVKGALGSSAHPAAGLQQVAGGPSMSMDGSNLAAHLPAPNTRDEAELRMEQTKQLKGPPDLDPEILKRRMKSVIDEYLFNCDLESAYSDVCGEFHPSMMATVAEEWITSVLEKHEEEVKKTGNLLNFLVTKHVLLPRQFSEAVKSIFQYASDYAIDIPKFWDFIGILIARPLASESALPLKFLQESAEVLVDKDEKTKYLASVLKALVEDVGPNKAGDLWNRSGLTLSQFMHPDQVPSFIAQNKFEFIDQQLDKKSLSSCQDAELRKGLESILIDIDKPWKNDAVFTWIHSNVPKDAQTSPAFIRTLTRVITQSSIKFGENCISLIENDFTERCSVLKRFVDAVMEREIQVLYALQLYMHELEHPTKMLHSIFHCLYNSDVISENAFFEWLEDKKVEQDLGRGVAVKSTTQFFTWLREDQDDE